MYKMNIKNSSIGVLIFIVFLIFLTYQANTPQVNNIQKNYERIKIANWNMQIFGESKANNAALMNSYVEKIKNYDIIFLQEIRDSSGVSSRTLCNMLLDYNCKISSRAGSTSSKEQYLIVYKKDINLFYFEDYNLLNYTDQFERPPIEAMFSINYTNIINYTDSQVSSFNLTIWNIHIKPDNVKQELTNLQSVITYEPYTIILGDLNADCTYYNPENETIFRGWQWMIKDDQDTTVSNTNCAYDRILIDNELFLRVANSGIDTDVTKEQSDHYIVWVEINKDIIN